MEHDPKDGLMRKRRAYLLEYMQISRDMLGILSNEELRDDDIERISSMIDRRGELIINLDAIGAGADEPAGDDADAYDEISRILEEIVRLQKDIDLRIDAHSRMVEKRLSNIRRSRKAIRCYYGRLNPSGKFIDRTR